jgi:hypothetical protein
MLKYAARHQSVWWNVYLIPGVSRWGLGLDMYSKTEMWNNLLNSVAMLMIRLMNWTNGNF